MKKKPFLKRAIHGVRVRLDEFVLRPTVGYIPRFAFGNNAGFYNNVASPLRLNRLRRLVADPIPAPDSQTSTLIQDGLVALDYPHDPDLVQRLKSKMESLLQDPSKYSEQGQPPYQAANQQIRHILDNMPETKTLLSPQVIRLVKGYYGSEFEVAMVRCWRNNHVPIDTEANAFSNQWHNDQFDTNVLKYFVYLSDGVSRDNGAFRAKTRAETKAVMRTYGFFRRSHIVGKAKRLIETESRNVFMEGNAGFSFVANPTLCLHRAGIPAPGKYRDIVQFTFLPSEKPLRPDWAATLNTEDETYL